MDFIFSIASNYAQLYSGSVYMDWMMVLGEPCFWQELQENWCKHFRTRKDKVMTSVISSLLYLYAPITKQYLWGFFQYHEYLLKSSCDITTICFPDKTIFILLDCFMQLLQIQRLAKYYPYITRVI